MTCRDLDRQLASRGSAALYAGRNHAATCPRCRDLLHAIAVDDAAGDLNPALAAEIAGRLAGDLTAVRPLPPAGLLTTAFALIFSALTLLGGLALGDRALLRMDWLTALFTFASLAGSACLVAFALTGEMTPGRRLAPPWVLASGILLGLALVFATLFPYREEPAFWLHVWRCLRAGLAAGSIAAALVWLILRRGAVLDPRACSALAGLLGGLTGTAILEMHCPDFNVMHIIVGHWGAAALGAGIGWIGGAIAARRG
jgi:Negative regulator of sigma F